MYVEGAGSWTTHLTVACALALVADGAAGHGVRVVRYGSSRVALVVRV